MILREFRFWGAVRFAEDKWNKGDLRALERWIRQLMYVVW